MNRSTKYGKRNRVCTAVSVAIATLAWVALVVLMGLDHAPADGATPTRSAPCVGHGERGAFEPGTPRAVAERRAAVRGVSLRRVDDRLIHGVAYLTCSGKRFVVLYFNDDETVASVIVA